jgi:hypothetical protein
MADTAIKPSSAQLRDDETFVITSLARSFSATWHAGENPPDAYLTFGADDSVAVEISILTQHVTDDRGTRSRLSDDMATAAFANALEELKSSIPDIIRSRSGLDFQFAIRRVRPRKPDFDKIIIAIWSLRNDDCVHTSMLG